MRLPKIATSAFAALTAFASLTVAGQARAEEQFDVSISGSTVTVTSKGDWHINKEFPWKLVAGDTKLDKSKFSFSEKSATLAGAPHGKATLKGAVCSAHGDQGGACVSFQKEVTIN